MTPLFAITRPRVAWLEDRFDGIARLDYTRRRMSAPVESTPYACPLCQTTLAATAHALTCVACDRTWPIEAGLPNFVGDLPPSTGLAQRFMESGPVVSIYEGIFRPAFTRLGSSISYDEEDRYLERWCTPVPGTIVDLACGTGRYTRWLLENVSGGAPVLGLDLSPPMLRRAQRDVPRAQLALASAETLPLADTSVGAVTCFGALHLFGDPQAAIREIARVLRPGGSFTCLTAGQAGGLRRGAQAVFKRVATFRFFEDRELTGWLEGSGLAVNDMSHRGMVLLFTATKRS